MAPSLRTGLAVGGVLAAGALVVARPWAPTSPPPAVSLATGPPVAAVVSPTSAAPARPVVYVAGAVVHPGVYALAGTARVADAVARAGGLTPSADALAVNLAAHVTDGEEIAVPRVGQLLPAPVAGPTTTAPRVRTPRGRGRRRPHAATAVAPASLPSPIDLNTADAAALETIPGIGATLAERIIAFRTMTGSFASVDGLADVAGITPSRLDAIVPYVVVRRP